MDYKKNGKKKQRFLFDEVPPRRSERPKSHHRTSPTSRLANEMAKVKVGSRKERVLSYLLAVGSMGAIRDEISEFCEIPGQSVPGIVRRLLDEGAIVEIDQRRPTRLGQPAHVLLHHVVASGRNL